MSKIDYQALREKAEKATSGVWSLEYGEGRFDGDDALIHREAAGYIPICRIEGAHPESGFDEDFQIEQQANAEFIAAANPATVLALLGELETAKKRIAELEAEPVSQTCKLNEPSGNSPVIPDGWISCSERMPEDTKMLLAFSQGEIVAAYWNWVVNPIDYKKYRAFTYLSGNILDDVTHWMPLPEPPL
ncbi:ead/Ea22-like family protein [Escherichia coli]|nr:ead/Ea22-like family protein [Escherichia coli]MCT9744988.1 ead/Ea22-like family protein [Escherichia coli]HBD4867267.1 ead/Ea22-like family protein [Escherichia coli]HBD4932880.1 ead/Ea22-like family protein [Escherichia coli]HBD5641961.1 ead/Ea22-like family protein [Escherichia coli]HBD5669645.1 ead/Ea22-like family protein [Escherichia coli]